jgi:hypothetical protein
MRFRGSRLLWGHLRYVREIEFTRFEKIEMGEMTAGLWDGSNEG